MKITYDDAKALQHKATEHIKSAQQPNGSFEALASQNKFDFTLATKNPTPFLTSLILGAIQTVSDTEGIIDTAAGYLISQQTSSGRWNYWEPSSTNYTMTSYPDDLDDAACALIALKDLVKPEQSGKLLAGFAASLINNEAQPGGPYRTWLIDTEDNLIWDDVDPAVNANVGRCLNAYGVNLSALEQYFDNNIRDSKLQSSFYISIIPTIYFMHTWYRGTNASILSAIIEKECRRPAELTTPILAMAITSGVAFSVSCKLLKNWEQELLSRQSNGCWQAQALYAEPIRNGVAYFAGSAALSTALAAQAINVLYARPDSMLHENVKLSLPLAEVEDTQLANDYNAFVAEMIAKDEINGQQIAASASITTVSMGADLSPTILGYLNSASVNGWCAYTIYDDIWDNAPSPELLAVANIAHRHMLRCFDNALPCNSRFARLVENVLALAEAANHWEVKRARAKTSKGVFKSAELPDYGNYSQLAARSQGHSLAAIGVYVAIGIKIEDPRIVALESFYRHFLIAKQLNDDAHDWEDDLCNGMLTSAVCLLLTNQPLKFNINKQLPELRIIFWENTITQISDLINHHCDMAMLALADTGMKNCQVQSEWIAKLRQSADLAINERNKTLQFIKSFTGTN